LEIGKRAYAAVHQLFPDKTCQQIAELIGCRKQAIYWWSQGETPSGIYLQRICELGADIDWILTGRRKDT
jgi:transcriptional regulator with XRE-family HTH domain